MPPASSFLSGFNCVIWNSSATATDAITIDPTGAETIDGKTTIILRRGEGTQIICDGSNWQTGNKKTMRGYAENIPTTYSRASAAGSGGTAVGSQSSAVGQDSIAVGYTCTATGTGSMAGGYAASAGSDYSLALGGGSGGYIATTATGAGAIALGNSYASGINSFAVHVQANGTTTYGAKGANSIALGQLSTATANNSTAIGNTSTASGSNSAVLGGTTSSATASYSIALGSYAKSDFNGKLVFGSWAISAIGDSQFGTTVLCGATTSATPKVLTTDNSGANSVNQVNLPNNSAFAFSGTIISRQKASAGNDYAAWEIKGAILRAANAASTVLGSYNINVLSKTAGASAWDLTLSADTTNGGLAVTATGAASVNIQWVATIKTSEVTYA
jgi:hypothetical protein